MFEVTEAFDMTTPLSQSDRVSLHGSEEPSKEGLPSKICVSLYRTQRMQLAVLCRTAT